MTTLLSQLGVANETSAAPSISGLPTYAAGPPPTLSITFASAHGLTAHSSWLTLAGFTPAGYNGLRVPVISCPSTTVAVVLLPSAIGTATVAGTATRSTPGTAVTPTRFYKANKNSLKVKSRPRVVSEGISGRRTRSKSQVVPYKDGVAGSISLDVLNKGYGFWLGKMMGGSVTTSSLGGSPTAYNHTWQLGDLNGDTFCAQINQPFITGVPRPVAFTGLKVSKAKLGMTRNGILKLDLDLIGIGEDDTVTLATASYGTAEEPVSFCGSSVSLDGVVVPCHEWEVEIDNGLADDTARIRGDCTPLEAYAEDWVEVSFKAKVDWRDYAFRAKYASLLPASGATNPFGALVIDTVWPVAISGANYPRVRLTMTAAEFDGDDPTIGGIELLDQEIMGVACDPENGTDTALKLEYTTADATP
jgi:hypothetical protein